MDDFAYMVGYIVGSINFSLIMHWPWTVLLIAAPLLTSRWILLLLALFMVSVADFILGLYDYVSGPTIYTIISRCIASLIAVGAGLAIRAVRDRLVRGSSVLGHFD